MIVRITRRQISLLAFAAATWLMAILVTKSRCSSKGWQNAVFDDDVLKMVGCAIGTSVLVAAYWKSHETTPQAQSVIDQESETDGWLIAHFMAIVCGMCFILLGTVYLIATIVFAKTDNLFEGGNFLAGVVFVAVGLCLTTVCRRYARKKFQMLDAHRNPEAERKLREQNRRWL